MAALRVLYLVFRSSNSAQRPIAQLEHASFLMELGHRTVGTLGQRRQYPARPQQAVHVRSQQGSTSAQDNSSPQLGHGKVARDLLQKLGSSRQSSTPHTHLRSMQGTLDIQCCGLYGITALAKLHLSPCNLKPHIICTSTTRSSHMLSERKSRQACSGHGLLHGQTQPCYLNLKSCTAVQKAAAPQCSRTFRSSPQQRPDAFVRLRGI